ncbi:MAG TPA: hypothetical protein VLG11_05070 [Candidatus Saccharimonadales bacterium]|nr:hypothetical protein [Candidatus Saccharimonadales bacterium]
MIAHTGAPFEAPSTERIDRILMYPNPVSYKSAGMQERMYSIEDATGIRVEIIASDASPERRADRLYQAAKKLGPTTLFVVDSGDGGANEVVAKIFSNPAIDTINPEARKSPVLFSAGGRANDTPLGLNSAWHLRSPGRVLTSAHMRIADAHPLKITGAYRGGEGKVSVIANGYWGLGASAAGARDLNLQKGALKELEAENFGKYRRAVREIGIVVRAALKEPSFDLEDHFWKPDSNSTQLLHNVVGFTVANGPRMAEHGRWPEQSLLDPKAGVNILRSCFDGAGRFPALAGAMARLKVGRLAAEPITLEQNNPTLAYTIEPRDGAQVLMQFDGETAPAPRHFEISAAPSFRVVTTRPSKNT